MEEQQIDYSFILRGRGGFRGVTGGIVSRYIIVSKDGKIGRLSV